MTFRLFLAAALALTGAGGLTSVPAVTTVTTTASAASVGAVTSTQTPEDPQTSVQKADLVVATADQAVPSADTATPEATTGPDTATQGGGTADPDAAPSADTLLDPATDPVFADRSEDGERVVTDPVDTADRQTLGVTWPEGTEGATLAPQVRTFTDGQWSDWVDLKVEDSAPDPGTVDETTALRGGTESLWIGDAEAVQLSFVAPERDSPEGLDLTLVGSTEVDPTVPVQDSTEATDEPVADANTAASVTEPVFSNAVVTNDTTSAVVTAAASQPTVISRAQWGARAQVCSPEIADSLVGAVVHHTAGSNSYTTVAQAMQQIRNDQAYHISGRGWCDIGYNFIVDKWGNIYEGRANSLTQPVIGVHAGGFNTGTVGVAMLGTYTAAPSTATQQSVGRIIGWRLGQYGIDPGGWMSYYTGAGENSRYKDQTVTLPRIFGHRDVSFTACPGDGGHAALDNIRAYAVENSDVEVIPRAEAEALVKAMYQDLLGRAPDSTGMSTWSNGLVRGRSTSDVTASITRSEEYNRRRITVAYSSILGRVPDEAGVKSWLRTINAGTVRIDDLADSLVASEEFYLQSGSTDSGMVQRLYQRLLGRDGTSAEISYWTTRVPTYSRLGVVRAISGSREAAQSKVKSNYQAFLYRLPDPAGLSTWTDTLLARGEAAVRNSLIGSTEYKMRALARFPA